MSSRPYDIALVPERDLAERAIQLSTDLTTLGSYYILDGKNFFPHLTLYMVQLNDDGLSKAIDILRSIASETKALKLIAGHYNYEHDYLDIEYIKTDAVAALQDRAIGALNPIRDGMREKDRLRLNTADGKARANLLAYGHRSVGPLFYPHLTMTRFTGNQESSLRSLPSKESFNGIFPSLGIFEMGDHGACTKSIATWPLLIA